MGEANRSVQGACQVIEDTFHPALCERLLCTAPPLAGLHAPPGQAGPTSWPLVLLGVRAGLTRRETQA